jgi:predicted nucleic acid-binding protein
MKPTFIDTSFLIALVLADDALHDRAIVWQQSRDRC